MTPPATHPFDFFTKLHWLDGRPLMRTIEPYRRRIFDEVLFSFDDDGWPSYDRTLQGRAKKNFKTTDLVLAGLYRFLVWSSSSGNDFFILANDEGQARDDLDLAKKLITANPLLDHEVEVKNKEIVRRDGRGTLKILPAQDVAGSHGKTYLFIGFDEIHAYRNHDLFEALSPDPTRRDVLTWITSYAGIRHAPGIPLYDMLQAGKAGDDPRLYFTWYGGDFTTDPVFQGGDVTPEQRANPSMASWGNDKYLADQRRRLPSNKYRRLHLNLPGAPDGAAFSGEHVMAAVVTGRKRLPPSPGIRYAGFVDMSGGSNDDSVLAVSHDDDGTAVVNLVERQTGRAPFDPRDAVKKFAGLLAQYHLTRVSGDAYGGQTFRRDFERYGISYTVTPKSASELYEDLEPRLNAGEVELPDIGELQEQLLSLVWRGSRIDHQVNDHDDFANACAGAVWAVAGKPRLFQISDKMLARARQPGRYAGPRYGAGYV